MTPDGDLGVLLIKGACNAGELARLGRNALPRGVPPDVIAAPPDYLAEKGASLSSLLRTAIEGTTLFADRTRLPYRPNAAAARAHEAPAAEPSPPECPASSAVRGGVLVEALGRANALAMSRW